MKKLIIFTDLDGTLLDYSTHSFEKALPALELLKQKKIPLIICSSKTRKEIDHYRKKLDNNHPFISENGGGIFIPKNYFKFKVSSSVDPPGAGQSFLHSGPAWGWAKFKVNEEKDYDIITLGAVYENLRNAIKELRSEGFNVRGFGDMTTEEVAEITGLSADEAEMAKERDFDEPFIFNSDEKGLNSLFDSIKLKGFNITEGRFLHILGNSDKGKAAAILIELYKKKLGEAATIAIGDSPNDIPMLRKVNYPVIVQKPDGKYDPRIDIPNLIKADGIGPEGWNAAILKMITQILKDDYTD